MSISKKELVEYVAANSCLTKKEAEEIVSDVFNKIADELQNGGEVSIHGFGKFSIKHNTERTMRPFGGNGQVVPASKGVKFSASATLKSALNK